MNHIYFRTDFAFQLTSAGTTGFAKPVLLTHSGLLNNGKSVGHFKKLSEDDTVCIPVPLFHCFGCVLGNLAALTHHSKIVYPDYGFNAEKILKLIQQEKVTSLLGVPTMFLDQLHHPKVFFSNMFLFGRLRFIYEKKTHLILL